MIAIILAAGFGNRMRPLTNERHKTLLAVAGEEILARIIDGIVANGVRRIAVVTGYRAEEVERFLQARYPALPIQYIRNERYRETNNIYSMALAFEAVDIDEDVLLIESDLVCDPAVFARAISSPHRNVALVDRYRTGMDGTVVEVRDSVITSVIPPHQQDARFDFSDKFKTLNIYKFDRRFCADTFRRLLTYYAKVIDSNCYYELILGMLIYMQQDTIHAELVEDLQWAEVDDPNDLRAAEFEFNPAGRLQMADQSFGGFWNHDFLDFGFIRNMYFPTVSMISEMKNSLEPLLHSYSSNHALLREKLGWFLLCRPEPLTVLGGGSQVFPILGEFLGNTRTWIPAPTFGEYRRVCRNVAEYPDSAADFVSMLKATAARGDAVVFVNPNNPTGRTIESEAIHGFAAERPDALVIVDESFVDFAGVRPVQELLEAAPLPNVVVIKSLSKTLGVPGLRLGYTYSHHAEFNAAMARAVPIWQLNSLAEFLLEISLKRRREFAESIARTCRDREEFREALGRAGVVDQVGPSGANFLLIRLRCTAGQAKALCADLLAAERIYVKNVSSKLADGSGYLRAAVRLPRENERFCAALSAAARRLRLTAAA